MENDKKAAMYVYIVEASSGSYDDFSWWIVGVFTDPVKAEECKEKVIANVKIDQNAKCPIEGVDNYDDMPDNATDSDWCKFSDWQGKRSEANDFNWCKVKEYELDKPCT